jgi:hypothetical protein
VNLCAARGEPHEDVLAELEQIVGSLPEGGWAALVLESRGYMALAAGRPSDARAAWRAGVDLSPSGAASGYALAGRAALWIGDAEGARADLAGLDGSGIHGAAIDNVRATLRAGITALEGRTAEALAGYRAANAAWRSLDLPWDGALTAIDMAHVLDRGLPEVRAAAAEARQILARIGARPFLGQLEALVAPGSTGFGDGDGVAARAREDPAAMEASTGPLA